MGAEYLWEFFVVMVVFSLIGDEKILQSLSIRIVRRLKLIRITGG